MSHFVLLMHPREAKRERLGTGRLTRACLPRTEIRVGFDFAEDLGTRRLIEDPSHRAFLLYPGGTLLGERRLANGTVPVSDRVPRATPRGAGHEPNATPRGADRTPNATPSAQIAPSTAPLSACSEAGRIDAGPDRPIRLFLLDGTWAQAKAMLKKSPNVAELPRLSIDPRSPSRFGRIKQQPGRLCLSTIESIHQYLEEANDAGLEATGSRHHVLLEVLDELCRQQLACANDPHRPGYRRSPYKAVEDRSAAKKWKQRKFFLGESG